MLSIYNFYNFLINLSIDHIHLHKLIYRAALSPLSNFILILPAARRDNNHQDQKVLFLIIT